MGRVNRADPFYFPNPIIMRVFFALFLFSISAKLSAAPFPVENGTAKAEIVISDSPTRMQRVAVEEFRPQIEKISGARLPIVTEPSRALGVSALGVQ